MQNLSNIKKMQSVFGRTNCSVYLKDIAIFRGKRMTHFFKIFEVSKGFPCVEVSKIGLFSDFWAPFKCVNLWARTLYTSYKENATVHWRYLVFQRQHRYKFPSYKNYKSTICVCSSLCSWRFANFGFIINVSFVWTEDHHAWSFQDLDNVITPSWTMIYGPYNMDQLIWTMINGLYIICWYMVTKWSATMSQL